VTTTLTVFAMFGIVQVQGLHVKETRYLRRSSGRGFPGVSGSRHQDACRPRDAGQGFDGAAEAIARLPGRAS
jgi:hypothetical protein